MKYKKVKVTQQDINRQNRLKQLKPHVYQKCLKIDEKLDNDEPVPYIMLQYKYICNSRCEHCSISDFQKKSLITDRVFTINDVKDLSRQADELGLITFNITGGEPQLFYDLDDLILAIDPDKFVIACDTNGLLSTRKRIQHLKDLGVYRMHTSLDSFIEEEHDSFRGIKGAYKQVLKTIDYILDTDLDILVATIVTSERLHSDEFIQFLEYMTSRNIYVSSLYPRLVGCWAGRYDLLISSDDNLYFQELCKKYLISDHLTPCYGRKMGCIAVKKLITITQFGDVMPCPYMYFSLGNIFTIPLKDILNKGMRYFGKYCPSCWTSQNRNFIEKYISKTYDKDIPVPIEQIMDEN